MRVIDPRELEMVGEHWCRGEFVCKCGCGFGLGPDDVDPLLYVAFDKLRALVGRPLWIVRRERATGAFFKAGSGCRCARHNKRIGGEVKSQHLLGRAGDVWGIPEQHLYEAMLEVPEFGAIGRYPGRGFCHGDVRPLHGGERVLFTR